MFYSHSSMTVGKTGFKSYDFDPSELSGQIKGLGKSCQSVVLSPVYWSLISFLLPSLSCMVTGFTPKHVDTPACTSKVMHTLANSRPLATLWTKAHTHQGCGGPRRTCWRGVHRPWVAWCFRTENCRLPDTQRTVCIKGGTGEGILLICREQ